MCAAWNGHTDCVRLLLELGADKDAKNHVRAGHFVLAFHLQSLYFCLCEWPFFECMPFDLKCLQNFNLLCFHSSCYCESHTMSTCILAFLKSSLMSIVCEFTAWR